MHRPLNRLCLTMVFVLFTFIAVKAQDQITGQVISSDDNQPIPGVNIRIKNTSNGAVTDINGKYKIEVKSNNDVLVYSFVGYLEQEVTVKGRSVIDVKLEIEVNQLDEIVVVGYGIQKKSDITGSTGNVKGDVMQQQPVLTATQAIQGKVAGVQIISSGQPGSSPQVRIRGVSSALAGTGVLYVVDGVLTDDISNINTSDIVDLNILKDASAAAIYGSRGANGVIIVTTKKGSSGPIKVNYNNNIGIRQASNLVEMANAAEYSNYVQAASGSIPPNSTYDTDWYDVILRTAWQQSHNISISGGNDKSTTLLSLGYLHDEGIVINNEFRRFTLRLNNEYNITEKLKVGLQSSYGNSINENAFGNIDIDAFGKIGSVYNNAYRAAPIIADQENGRYGNTSAYQNVGNPLLGVNNNSVKVKENRYQGTGYIQVKPLSWITVKSSIGSDIRNSLNRVYNYQFNADEETFLISGGNQYASQSSLNVKQTQTFRWVWDNTATIVKEFGDHQVTLLVGTTAEKYNLHSLTASRRDVAADPNLWYIGTGDANTSQNDGKGDSWARNSYLARVNYGYKSKYLLTATIRRDGSSRLPSVNRWQVYPSVGLAWIMSREGFMNGQSLFDNLKLRASYGKVGNDQIPTDAFTKTVDINKAYAFNGSASSAINGAQIRRIIDPNITWEITEEYNAAVEFALFSSKLTGEVTYYNKKVENALINIPVLKNVGDVDGLIYRNVASIQNQGVEISLNWNQNIGDDWSYSFSTNATFNNNRVLALNGGQATLGGGIGASQGYTTSTDNGHAVGSFYVLKVDGVFNSADEVTAYTNHDGLVIQPNAKAGDFRYVDKNGDGKIDDGDRFFAGSYQPVAYFGLNASVKYKQLDLSISFYGNVGNQVYNGKKAVRVAGKDNVEKELVYSRWTSQNHTQTEPAANGGNLLASDYFVESGTFVRVNNLTLGYTFSPDWIEKLRLTSCRVFATSQNPFTFKKYSGFTSELPGDPISSGIELSTYPTTRTIAVGINVGF